MASRAGSCDCCSTRKRASRAYDARNHATSFGFAKRRGVEAGPFDEIDSCPPFCWAVARGWAALCCQNSRSSSARAKDSRSTGLPVRAAVHDHEGRGDWAPDDAVGPQVLLNLPAGGNRPDFRPRPLGLDRAAGGELAGLWGFVRGVLELFGREQPAVGNARPLVPGLDDAADPGLESLAEGVEQVGQGGIVRRLRDARAAERGCPAVP